MKFEGILYRALNPVYASQPLSGRGAELYSGRFNKKGQPALYLSLSVMTAIREANQAGYLQPTTVVSYEAVIENVFDCRDQDALHGHGFSAERLADNGWRNQMRANGISETQSFAARLIEAGYRGLLVRSFTPGAKPDDFNMVLWKWDNRQASGLKVIDDEDRPSST